MASRIKWAGIAAVAIALAFVPLLLQQLGGLFWINVIAEIMIWSLLAASVNLLLGYVGLLSFGQALYFGFGMYGVAIGVSHFGLGLWPAFFLGVFAASAMAAIAGAIAGVGTVNRFKAVRWGVAANIVWAWVLTIPASAAVAWVSYLAIQQLHPGA